MYGISSLVVTREPGENGLLASCVDTGLTFRLALFLKYIHNRQKFPVSSLCALILRKKEPRLPHAVRTAQDSMQNC